MSPVFVKKPNLFLFYENIQVKDKSPIKENDVVQENNMDSEAFKTCIENHGKAVYSFCRYLTRERFDADDLYQQTFLVAFEKGEISEVGNPRSYLITIAANLWNNMKRKKGWRAKRANIVYLQDEEMNQLADDRISVEDAMIKNEEAEAVRVDRRETHPLPAAVFGVVVVGGEPRDDASDEFILHPGERKCDALAIFAVVDPHDVFRRDVQEA